MYMDNENHSPSLFGFDLFRLISLQIHTYGISLSILPNWFWVHVCFLGEGTVLMGSLAGRSFEACRMSMQPLPAGMARFDYEQVGEFHEMRFGQVLFSVEKAGA